MKLINTKWLVYSESGAPWWVLLVILLIIVLLSRRWFRITQPRSLVAAKSLPWLWYALIVLAIWLIWQPVLVRIDEWQHNAKCLKWLDHSLSMNNPLFSKNISRNLDLLQFWTGKALPGRNENSRKLHQELNEIIHTGNMLNQSLTDYLEEQEKMIPGSLSSTELQKRYQGWKQEIVSKLGATLENVRADLKAETSEDRKQAASDLLNQLADLDKLSVSLGMLDANAAPAAWHQAQQGISGLVTAAKSVQPSLESNQLQADQAYRQKNSGKLDELLKKYAAKTRFDAAQVLAQLPEKPLTQPSKVTDIYQSVKMLLDLHSDDVISDLIVFSDGGQNGSTTSDLPSRLKKAGIKTTVVGTSLLDAKPDYAILDWQIPTILSAGKETSLQVRLKMPRTGDALQLQILTDGKELKDASVTPDGKPEQTLTLSFKAPSSGPHMMTVKIKNADANTGNNKVDFQVYCTPKTLKALVLADMPNWDSVYFALALERVGVQTRQLFFGARGKKIRRGGSSKSIPSKLMHWKRYQLLILIDPVFPDFSDKDAETLVKYMKEKGGNILLVTNRKGESYLNKLAPLLSVTKSQSQQPVSGRLTIPQSALSLPLVRLNTDGSQSALMLQQWHPVNRATPVPSQQLTILSVNDLPVLSLGFYGEGKLYASGIHNWYQLGQYQQSREVNRLLFQLVSDVATPLFPDPETPVVSYPQLPIYGESNLLISRGPETETVSIAGKPLKFSKGDRHSPVSWVPQKQGVNVLKTGAKPVSLTVIDNPGMERVFYEFNPAFLKNLATESGGRYLPMLQASQALKAIQPGTWQQFVSKRYPLARHWSLLVLTAFIGTLYWIARKLAGLAI